FDTAESHKRNSFYWSPRQFDNLSLFFKTNVLNESFDPSNITSNDFVRARYRHWLQRPSPGIVGRTLSVQREPSPDGAIPGQTKWYDYEGKPSGTNWLEGTKNLPRLVGWLLPDGNSRYSYSDRNSLGRPTRIIESWSASVGTAGLRTNWLVYTANNIDVL